MQTISRIPQKNWVFSPANSNTNEFNMSNGDSVLNEGVMVSDQKHSFNTEGIFGIGIPKVDVAKKIFKV